MEGTSEVDRTALLTGRARLSGKIKQDEGEPHPSFERCRCTMMRDVGNSSPPNSPRRRGRIKEGQRRQASQEIRLPLCTRLLED